MKRDEVERTGEEYRARIAEGVEIRPVEWVVFDRAPFPAWNGSTAGATMVPAGHYVAHDSCARRAGKVDGQGFPVHGFATAPTWGEPRACSECSGELC